MSNTDGPAALRRLATSVSCGFAPHPYDIEVMAAQWQAEREQAAADRAALERARALLAEAEARRMTRYETNDDTDFWYRVLGWLGGAR